MEIYQIKEGLGDYKAIRSETPIYGDVPFFEIEYRYSLNNNGNVSTYGTFSCFVHWNLLDYLECCEWKFTNPISGSIKQLDTFTKEQRTLVSMPCLSPKGESLKLNIHFPVFMTQNVIVATIYKLMLEISWFCDSKKDAFIFENYNNMFNDLHHNDIIHTAKDIIVMAEFAKLLNKSKCQSLFVDNIKTELRKNYEKLSRDLMGFDILNK